MKIWLITVGEPLPIEGDSVRLLRTGLLAQTLSQNGHEVTWWSSSFNHTAKKHHAKNDLFLNPIPNYRLILLHANGYKKNISLRRIYNHIVIGKKFRRYAEREARPDIILCSFPTIELGDFAVKYGKKHDIPVVLDVRDLWPDIFIDAAPQVIRPIGSFLLRGLVKKTSNAFNGCTAIIGTSQRYLNWGLKYAGRKAAELDRVFPIGYHKHVFSDVALESARSKIDALGIPKNSVNVWFCGVFGTTYDLNFAIRAAQKLNSEQPERPTCFIFTGDGEEKRKYEAMAEGTPNIIFTGWLNAAEIQVLTQKMHIGLAAYAPHAPQSLPNKLFEYLSAGLPILSSLKDEAADLLSQYGCGLTYDARSFEDFFSQLIRLTESDTLRAEMRTNGLKLFASQFETISLNIQIMNHLKKINDTFMKSKTKLAPISNSTF